MTTPLCGEIAHKIRVKVDALKEIKTAEGIVKVAAMIILLALYCYHLMKPPELRWNQLD